MPKVAMAILILLIIVALVTLYAPSIAQGASLLRRFVRRQYEKTREYYRADS